MIPEVQGPVYLGCLSICKSELGLGRDVRVGDEVFIGSMAWVKRWIACQLPMGLVRPLSRIA